MRIYGLETEFGVSSVSDAARCSPEEVARQLFRSIVAQNRSSNVFLPNGARVYLDVGSHPEYATAECRDLPTLLAQDRAGEQVMGELAAEAEGRLAQAGTPTSVFLFRNNLDSAGNSYGCHENYLVSRETELSRYAAVLIPFLVSRPLLCGAGRVRSDGSFELSQRADQIWEGISSATTRTRPMINTRDEPHADPERYRRLHVIVGDTNVAEPSAWLKVGSTELVLRLIESGRAIHDFTLANPARALRQASRDPHAPLELANGRALSAVQLQGEFVAAVRDMGATELQAVVDLWEEVVTAVREGDPQRLADRIDWAIKQQLVQRYADKHGLASDSARLRQLDLAYHDIHPGRGLGRLLESRGVIERLTTDDDVARAMAEPPSDTRARLRGRFVAAARAAGADYSVDWISIKLNSGPQARTVLCKDPFCATDERVERLIEAVTSGT